MPGSKRRRLPWIAAGVHLGLVVAAILAILAGTEPDWPLVWVGFMVVDFPISLLYAALNSLRSAIPSTVQLVRPYSAINDVWNFLAPASFFGICGSVWWFLLGGWIQRWRSDRARDEGSGLGHG
jgi:hypothetical protein